MLIVIVRSLLVALLGLALSAQPVLQAAPPPPPDLVVQAADGATRVHWQHPLSLQSTDQDDGWTSVQVGDRSLPVQLIALRVADNATVTPQIASLVSSPWAGSLPPASIDLQATLQPPSIAFPDSPVFVLREGRMRGVRIVVIAISPLFGQNSQLQIATSLDLVVPNAVPYTAAGADRVSSLLAAAPIPDKPGGTSPLRILVAQAGMQRISGAMLAAAGLDLAALDPARLRISTRSEERALELRGADDGKLEPADELRFYAPTPGDRWNATDTYWLTIAATPGLRMSRRSAQPASAPVRTTATQRGVWRSPAIYDSWQAGSDGDHWFAANLRAEPNQPASVTVPLTPTLPLAPGPSTITLRGSTRNSGSHQLTARMSTATQNTIWTGSGDWQRTFAFDANAAQVALSLSGGANGDTLALDDLAWERPVALDGSGNGAIFGGVAGTWRYQFTNPPANAALYDISDPRAPTILEPQFGASVQWQDGPAARDYLITGPGTLHTPFVAAVRTADLVAPLNADVIYIAPPAFHPALQPLVERRRARGRVVQVVDPQAIYDGWSGGQVDPDAIRNFLRYAAATWDRIPSAVTLVGDGTSDPRNYTRRNNPNLIPPFLALVDPWLGETACETCYAQLDGDDPLSDPLPDLALGRLPVKNAAELQAVVAKIIRYESDRGGLDWRSRIGYVADNADNAGDFAAIAEQSAAEQPRGVQIQRLFYDPTIGAATASREPSAGRAWQRTADMLNAGAGIVNYVGHSHQWQWGITDVTATPSTLLGLYDVDALRNGDRLPIVLEMTCLTSAFHTPAYSGTTIDERFVLHPSGGAIATWGPTGLGVTYGHDALQRGFYRSLWAAPPQTATLGDLTNAGYLELFAQSGCCQDTLRTFALLGDPLTPARVAPAERVYVPLVRR